MKPKKRLHELAKELDVTTDRLMEIAQRLGIRFSSNFNAVEPDQEEKLRTAVMGPIRKQAKPIVKIIKTAKQKEIEAIEQARLDEEEEAAEHPEEYDEMYEEEAQETVAPVAEEEHVEVLPSATREEVEEETVEPIAAAPSTVETHPAVEPVAAMEPAGQQVMEPVQTLVAGAATSAPALEEAPKEATTVVPAVVKTGTIVGHIPLDKLQERMAAGRPDKKKIAAAREARAAAQQRPQPRHPRPDAQGVVRTPDQRVPPHPETRVPTRPEPPPVTARPESRPDTRPEQRKESWKKPATTPEQPFRGKPLPHARDYFEAEEHDTGFGGQGRRRRKKKKERPAEAPTRTATQTATGKRREKSPTAPSVDHVMITEGMTIKDLSEKLGIKAKDIIQKLFLEKKILANINQVLDMELAKEIATSYGVTSEQVSFEDEIALTQELKVSGDAAVRAPVVTIMGHVDHGKTTLLDYIRKTKVAAGEAGGITQHIGAYSVMHRDQRIVFLDTPGHAAFTRLRARGAQVTDVVILVIAADDGVMPQTVESIQHARAAKVPMVVAITKADKPQANLDKVKRGLSENDVLVEDWGGQVVAVPVSGKSGMGVEDLLEMIILTAEMQNLKAYPEIKGQGSVIEARLDKARGPVATVLVQNGTVKVSDFFIAGTTYGKIKAMFNDKGAKIEDAGPSTPVEILGFSEVPEAGDQFQCVEDESKARQTITFRKEQQRQVAMSKGAKLTLDDLFSRISQGDVKELPLIVKGDVKGSVEALSESLEKLSTDKVKIKIMLSQPGAITESDVLLASASNAIIIGFNVRAEKSADAIAQQEGVEIRTYNIIYETIKDIKDAMRGMLAPTIKEVQLGKAEVRQIFKVPKIGVIAGCYVTEGLVRRTANARLVRDNIVIFDGKPMSLKRFKEDAREVKQGFECGIGLDGTNDLREGDIIEFYTREEVAAEL